jgi:hypothetical protein
MADWYRDHTLSPEAYPDSEYLGWAQDQGAVVDAAGNVDFYAPMAADVYTQPGRTAPAGFDDDDE